MTPRAVFVTHLGRAKDGATGSRFTRTRGDAGHAGLQRHRTEGTPLPGE